MKDENIHPGYNKLESRILKWFDLQMSSDSGRVEMEGYDHWNSNGTSLSSPPAGFLGADDLGGSQEDSVYLAETSDQQNVSGYLCLKQGWLWGSFPID